MDVNRFSTPINKTAALVTQQSQENDLDKLRVRKADIVRALTSLRQQKAKNGIGYKIQRLQGELSEINREIKKLNIAISDNKTEQDWILKECAAMFSKEEWAAICHRARQKKINYEFSKGDHPDVE